MRTASRQDWLGSRRPGYRDHADVVFLAKGLAGFGDARGRGLGANQFEDPVETEELALVVGGFGHAIGDEQQPVARRQPEFKYGAVLHRLPVEIRREMTGVC